MDTLTRIKAARALIDEPTKWTKGKYNTRGRKRLCMWEALRETSEGRVMEIAAIFRPFLTDRPRVIPSNFHPIISFNDASETSHADVMAVFDEVIHHLENTPCPA